MNRQIIAGGTDVIPDVAFQHYILAQANKEKPKLCLLPTPSGDNIEIIRTFFKVFNRYNCDLDYLPLFHNKESNHRDFLLKQDIIIVCGGQSKSALLLWQGWGIDKILLEAYNNGTIMAGGSAGSVQWFSSALSDSAGGDVLKPVDFMGFLPYSHCPHYRSQERRAAYKQAILSREIKPGYAIGDGAAIHFQNEKFFRAVSSDEKASCFYVDIDSRGKEEKIHSERLSTHYLMNQDIQNNLIWSSSTFNYLNDIPNQSNSTEQ